MKVLAFSANPVTWSKRSVIGGAEIRYTNILKRWYERGVDIVSVESPSSTSKRLGANYPIYTIRFPYNIPLIAKFVIWTLACLRFVLSKKGEGFDFIYVPTNNVSDLAPSILAKAVLRRPLIINVQNSNPVRSFRSVLGLYGGSFVDRLLLTSGNLVSLHLERYCDMIIAVSEATKDALVKAGLDERRIVVNGMGVEERQLGENFVPRSKIYDMVFIGRIEREKGIFDLIRALRLLAEKQPTTNLLVIGDGIELSRVIRLAEEEKVRNNITFAGPIYGDEKYDLLRKSKFMVYPTFSREGFCLSILDALSVGLPVITYDEHFTVEAYKDCKAVRFVSLRNIDELAGLLSDFIRMSVTDFERLSNYAYDFIRARTWDEIAGQELTHVENHMGSKTKRVGDFAGDTPSNDYHLTNRH